MTLHKCFLNDVQMIFKLSEQNGYVYQCFLYRSRLGTWGQHFRCMKSVEYVHLIVNESDTVHYKWLDMSSALTLLPIKLFLGKTD